MPKGLDYSFSHPDLHCTKRSGYSFVARYIGDPDPNSAKYLDADELKRIRDAGLDVVVVRETTAGFMITDSGAQHAQVSRRHCNDLGLFNIPIYYALDVDTRGLTVAELNRVTRFLVDAAAVDGGGKNVGLYGNDDAMDNWVGTEYCHWGWQTYAWSGGRISHKAHFRQYLNGQNICGGTVDLNETYTPDFGQWPRPTTTPIPIPTPMEEEEVFYVVLDVPPHNVALGGPGYWKHLDGPQHAIVGEVLGRGPKTVDQGEYDNLRAACVHGDVATNPAVG